MAGPEDWGATPVAAQDDGPASWGATRVATSPAEVISDPAAVRAAVDANPRGYFGNIAAAFKSGAEAGYGDEPLGFSDANKKWLNDTTSDTFKAFANEVLIPAVAHLDKTWRTPNSIYHAFGDALMAAGLPRDFVALAGGEAFYGTPNVHPTTAGGRREIFHAEPSVAQLPLRAAAAAAAPPSPPIVSEPTPVAAILSGGGTPVFHDTSAAGLEGILQNGNINPSAPAMEAGSAPSVSVSRDFSNYSRKADSPFRLIIDKDEVGHSSQPINASGFSRGEYLNESEERFAKPIPLAAVKGIAVNTDVVPDVPKAISDLAKEKGIPIEKYSAQDTSGSLAAFSRDPVERLGEATELGVIGPERPRLAEGTPDEAAQAATKPRVMAADQKPDETIKSEPGQDPWQQRFNQFVDKLETPGDVKQLIRDAANENDNFPAARQGEIPLAHVESLAEAAGVAADTVDRTGAGRLMQNDAQVRIGMQTMLQATEAVKDAARAVKTDGSPESMIKLQESMMRRDMAVEQIVGMRAEWGRTGGVFQEFMRDVKDQESLNEFLKGKGRTPGDLKDIADALDTLDRTQAARVLSDMHAKAPTPFYWTWVNGLISGWLTHTKYVAANALYAVSENGVTPVLASMIGKAKQVFGSEADRVYFGEPMAATWGMISAVPGAIMATAKSVKSGQRAVLESEIEVHKAMIERGEKVPALIDRAVNQVTGQGRPTDKLFGVVPLDGVWGRIIGSPGDAAMGIHTFFKVLGERAGIEAEAYRAAAKEGLSPTDAAFWSRRSEHAENPTEAMRQNALAGAYKGTFMAELGPHGKAWQRFTKDTPGLKWVFPFSHIPLNLIKATYEHTPLAALDADMRADITGKNGGVKQDKAIARMVGGSALMGYFVHQGLMGRATGDYPIDPKERDAWKLAGKQPNSILVNGYWVSYNKFGPAGDLANLAANIAYVIPKLTSGDDDAMTQGTFHAANAAAHLIVDEVGFQSLANLFDAMHDEKKGAAWAASTAASFIPFSSALGQTASYRDPYMRQAKTFFDGIKYKLPNARETLLPKRDWLGEPIPNAQYGNILRQRQAITDPVSQEMMRLEIHPGPPSDRLGGVKLTPEAYDRYQTVAGAFTKQALDTLVASPGWSEQSDFMREMAMRSTIGAARKMAAGAMQAANPTLIDQGLKQRINHITGATHTDRPKVAPALQ